MHPQSRGRSSHPWPCAPPPRLGGCPPARGVRIARPKDLDEQQQQRGVLGRVPSALFFTACLFVSPSIFMGALPGRVATLGARCCGVQSLRRLPPTNTKQLSCIDLDIHSQDVNGLRQSTHCTTTDTLWLSSSLLRGPPNPRTAVTVAQRPTTRGGRPSRCRGPLPRVRHVAALRALCHRAPRTIGAATQDVDVFVLLRGRTRRRRHSAPTVSGGPSAGAPSGASLASNAALGRCTVDACRQTPPTLPRRNTGSTSPPPPPPSPLG